MVFTSLSAIQKSGFYRFVLSIRNLFRLAGLSLVLSFSLAAGGGGGGDRV